jgi:3-deoxy-D-manno-octulosonate 8-phosphate phosphatase (KDO 8-P phosphatase)
VSPELARVARDVRLVFLDVDGVMTDGGVYLGATEGGEKVEVKRFSILDGLGIHLMQRAGITPVIITGRVSEAVRMRAAELGIEECHQTGAARKLEIAREVLDRRGLGWESTACLADDLADLPVLRRVALPAAVRNAVPEVRAIARWVSRREGGSGAVRELIEALLRARGAWTRTVEGYLDERDDEA